MLGMEVPGFNPGKSCIFQYFCASFLVKRGIRNCGIGKTHLLQIVQLVVYSIVIVLYLPCDSSAWHATAMNKQQLGEH